MEAEPNPTMARRRLAVRLSAVREQSGRTLDDLATFLGVSLAQASRLDTGARGFKAEHIDKLGDWYEIGRTERELLNDLVDESRKRAWWQQIDLPDAYRTLIGMEQAAESISEYGGSVLPGLLQTPEYALAAIAGGTLDVRVEEMEQAAVVRDRRQWILRRPLPPYLWVVIDEAVLARTTGSASIMDRQLLHLLDMASTPRVTVQVVGFEAGTHLGSTHTHFVLLGMGHGFPDVLYTEGRAQPGDTVDQTEVGKYRRVWDMLRALALDPSSSRSRIDSYRLALGDVHEPADRDAP